MSFKPRKTRIYILNQNSTSDVDIFSGTRCLQHSSWRHNVHSPADMTKKPGPRTHTTFPTAGWCGRCSIFRFTQSNVPYQKKKLYYRCGNRDYYSSAIYKTKLRLSKFHDKSSQVLKLTWKTWRGTPVLFEWLYFLYCCKHQFESSHA